MFKHAFVLFGLLSYGICRNFVNLALTQQPITPVLNVVMPPPP